MEFFVCLSTPVCNVILDGVDQGANKNDAGEPLAKQCNSGYHSISLRCPNGRNCTPPEVTINIRDTDPIQPLEVSFQCA